MNEENRTPGAANDEIGANSSIEKTEMLVNDYGATKDSTVVIEEEDRTVLLTDKETIVIEKQPMYDIVPNNRPHKVYAGMWGQTEIATVGVGMLAILTVILLFIFLVLPAKKELEAKKAEQDRLESERRTAINRYGTITSTEEQVAKLVASVDDFETRFLPIAANGKTALYQRINGLISAYGLVNTSGPDYAPLEIADGRGNQQTSEEETGRNKFQSIFPGVYVTMTVEGSYQNLRRFLREVETSNQFVVVSAVELEPSENSEKEKQSSGGAVINSATLTQQTGVPLNPNGGMTVPPATGAGTMNPAMPGASSQPQNRAARGRTIGETVSLRLEMAAYFRRPNFVPLAPEAVNQ